MKRPFKLAITLIFVLALSVSVMVVSAGAVETYSMNYSLGSTSSVSYDTLSSDVAANLKNNGYSNATVSDIYTDSSMSTSTSIGSSYTFDYSLTSNILYASVVTDADIVHVTITLIPSASAFTAKATTNTITVEKSAEHEFTYAEVISNYVNSNFISSYATKSNYKIVITSVGSSTYGQAYYNSSKLLVNQAISYAYLNSGYFTYKASTVSSSSYDTITFDILYNGYTVHSGLSLRVKVAESTASSQDFSIGYDSSDTSVTFTKKDFTNHFDSDADIDYVVFTDLPSTKYGILYNGTEKSSNAVDEDEEIEYADLGKLLFVFGSSFTDGSAKLEYYIIDDDGVESNTATITITNALQLPVAYDYAIGVEQKDTYEFDGDEFDEAYYSPDGESLDSIKITALPEEGTLYLGSSEVSVGDTVSYKKLSSLKYKAVKGDYRDSFSWQAYDGENYSAASANMQFVVFEDEIVSAGGDMTVYLDDDEVEFSSDAFERVYVTDDDENYLDSIKITSLPSDGTLYRDGTAKSNYKISKNDTLTYDELDDLLYVADSGFSDEDSFDYRVKGEDDDDYCDKDYGGTVTIKQSTGGYDYTVSGNTMTLTFNEQTPSSGAVSGELTASDITALLSEAKEGTTLVVYLPATTSATTRTLTIDNSLFTTANVKTISTIKFVDGEPSDKEPVTVTLKTAAILAQYSHSESAFSISIANESPTSTMNTQYNSSLMRTVTMKIGTTAITNFPSVGSAIISFYSNASSAQSSMAVVLKLDSASSNSATPVVSSRYNYSTRILTADFSSYGSGSFLAGVNAVSFTDMNSVSNWEYDYVISLAARGVISGYPEGTYLNKREIKRSEYIKLLVECFGLEVEGASCWFTDVSSSDWYYTYLASAVKCGVLTDGTAFNAESYITREDMALYSYRAALAGGVELTTNITATTFTDQSSINSTYTAAIQAMQRAGIINGYPDGSFKPKGTTVRGDAAKVISLLLDQYYAN